MNKRIVGTKYEQIAADFLKQKNIQILEMNYRCRAGEIDLIVRDGNYLVFVEVKYRSTDKNGYPEEAVTKKKQKIISFVSKYYCFSHNLSESTPIRFDVVSICGTHIRWLKHAFDFQYGFF